jgi:uncharacterized protein YbjT (DUF2867 family)
MKTALVAGSTGLVGSQLLELLLSSEKYKTVIALTRRDVGIEHAKLIQVKADFSKLEVYKDELKADDVFCCLGTTMAKARSKEKFREVDYTYPVKLASVASTFGANQFLLVSALGADKNSSIYYNRVKGEVENEISKFNFRAVHIFRPSLLLGPRRENRSGEEAAKVVYKVFGFLIPAKYKAIHSLTVAKAMLHHALQEQQGVFIHESHELQKF